MAQVMSAIACYLPAQQVPVRTSKQQNKFETRKISQVSVLQWVKINPSNSFSVQGPAFSEVLLRLSPSSLLGKQKSEPAPCSHCSRSAEEGFYKLCYEPTAHNYIKIAQGGQRQAAHQIQGRALIQRFPETLAHMGWQPNWFMGMPVPA